MLQRRDENDSSDGGLARDMDLAGLALAPGTLRLASKTLAIILCVALAPIALAGAVIGQPTLAAVLAFVSVTVPLISAQAVLAYPATLARKRASSVLRNSPEATNLMIMSLRHDSSVSKAIAFASKRKSPFSRELKRCVWGVVMGGHSSFEEALHGLGRRWAMFSTELNTSLDALVTASREPTQDGRRRALDRANSAMISGAKRRIEEYALSLSAPSMVMFALGILLPLMVGSFLPMLSWNLWSLDAQIGRAHV